MTVRTRIAPSPTGDPHVGTAYMALFNWVFARQMGGEFLLRIEDTDQARSTAESEQTIFAALRWLGLEWDEGPDVGGSKGPYRQSERRSIYDEHLALLLNDGHAFHCFCSKQRLDDLRREQQAAKQTTRYDGHCLSLDEQTVQTRLDAGEEYVVRMKVPDAGDCVFVDRLRREISIPYAQVDMQVLRKADGMPTYHFAVVVDDHLMEITHILRGEEWINSVPKHKLLFGYFGWEMPEMVHLPLLRNPDQSKLSKRKNPTGINYYRDAGYLPEALLNYLALMGWSMPNEAEIFSLQEMVDGFDVDRVSVRGPIFDVEKFDWLNGQYLRSLDTQAYANRVQEWFGGEERLKKLIPLVQERAERLSDLVPLADYLLGAIPTLSKSDFDHKKLSEDDVAKIVFYASGALDDIEAWHSETIMAQCQKLADALELKFRDFLAPLFIAVSGRSVTLPLFDSMEFLGREITRARLRTALDALEISGKQKKRLEKERPKID
jgi:glutamyl-tRNA synthetase